MEANPTPQWISLLWITLLTTAKKMYSKGLWGQRDGSAIPRQEERAVVHTCVVVEDSRHLRKRSRSAVNASITGAVMSNARSAKRRSQLAHVNKKEKGGESDTKSNCSLKDIT